MSYYPPPSGSGSYPSGYYPPPTSAGLPPGPGGPGGYYPTPTASGLPPGSAGYPLPSYPGGPGYPSSGGYPPCSSGMYPPGPAYPPSTGYPTGHVMDVRGGMTHPGVDVITYSRKMDRSLNQLWWTDHNTGVIHSALNEFVLTARRKETVRLMPYTGQPDQQWIFAGNRIMNRIHAEECLDAKSGIERAITAKKYKCKPGQHWHVEYVM